MLIKRKRCKQCGWDLNRFSRQDFCGEQCVSIWDQNKRESESSRQKKGVMTGIEEINFIGTGSISGKDVEVHFTTTGENMSWDKEDRENPKLIMQPITTKDQEIFLRIIVK